MHTKVKMINHRYNSSFINLPPSFTGTLDSWRERLFYALQWYPALLSDLRMRHGVLRFTIDCLLKLIDLSDISEMLSDVAGVFPSFRS